MPRKTNKTTTTKNQKTQRSLNVQHTPDFPDLTVTDVASYPADAVGARNKVPVIELTQGTQHDVREVVQHHLVTDADGAKVLWLGPQRCVLGPPTA